MVQGQRFRGKQNTRAQYRLEVWQGKCPSSCALQTLGTDQGTSNSQAVSTSTGLPRIKKGRNSIVGSTDSRDGSLLNTAGPRTWPRGRDRPFQVLELDPPWRSLEPGGNVQQAGFWRYRWRTERMAIRYDRPQQGRQTGEDAGGVLECENLECENKEHPRLEQEDKKNDRKQKTNNRKLSVIRQRRHGRDLRFGFFTARSLPSQSPLSSARSRPYAALPGR